jgi:hypothetical protein
MHNEELHNLYSLPNIIKVKVKLSLYLTKHHDMKSNGGVEV